MARINRYAMKRKHKRELEKKYATQYRFGSPCNVRILRDELMRKAEEEDSWWLKKYPPRNNGWEYWKSWDLSGARGYAKKYSDKRIRQRYREMIKKMDPEEIIAPRGADYEKEYDYLWTIW